MLRSSLQSSNSNWCRKEKMLKPYFIVLFVFLLHAVHATMHEDDMNPDFILRSDLMPGSLLMIDDDDEVWTNNTAKFRDGNKKGSSLNGSWYDAFTTMGFHRKMFNEYLCRNFVADEILSQIKTPLLSHRIGRPFSKSETDKEKPKIQGVRNSRADVADVKDNLLSDPGSSNYRDWLSKTATLEDVYRHYDMTVSRGGGMGGVTDDNEDVSGDEYDGGEFTGYAMPGPANGIDYSHPVMPMGPPFSSYGQPSYMPPQDPNMEQEKYGEGGGFDYAPHHVHFHSDSDKSSNHGLALQDIFDIALTALAFLSFGMFILQVIMCITASKPMAPMMQMTDTDTETVQDELRFKRSVHQNGDTINDLARRVLNSIEAGISADLDDGACVRWTLCENNKYSRKFQDNQKFWIPVWGLGMSWLSSRFIEGTPTSSIMLESLRACALGLAQVDCSSIYPDCDMRHLLGSRKTKRPPEFQPSARERKGDKG